MHQNEAHVWMMSSKDDSQIAILLLFSLPDNCNDKGLEKTLNWEFYLDLSLKHVGY